MRRAASVILPLTVALGIVAYRRPLSRLISSVLARGFRRSLALAAYRHSLTREHISQEDLLKLRSASDEWHTAWGRKLFGQLLFAMAEIARLKRRGEVEVRVVSIPGDWSARVEGTFVKETMNNLVDLGESMGANPSSWSDQPPRY